MHSVWDYQYPNDCLHCPAVIFILLVASFHMLTQYSHFCKHRHLVLCICFQTDIFAHKLGSGTAFPPILQGTHRCLDLYILHHSGISASKQVYYSAFLSNQMGSHRHLGLHISLHSCTRDHRHFSGIFFQCSPPCRSTRWFEHSGHHSYKEECRQLSGTGAHRNRKDTCKYLVAHRFLHLSTRDCTQLFHRKGCSIHFCICTRLVTHKPRRYGSACYTPSFHIADQQIHRHKNKYSELHKFLRAHTVGHTALHM